MWKKLPVKERMELMKTYKKGGYSYGGMVKDYNDSFESYKQAGPVAESLPENNDGMTGMMKSKIATESHYGNPSAQRMVSPNPNRYDFGNGYTGTHYMGSYGNEARPGIQEVEGEMKYYDNPPRNSRENMRFNREQDARYFAENYKDVAPMMRQYPGGGIVGDPIKPAPIPANDSIYIENRVANDARLSDKYKYEVTPTRRQGDVMYRTDSSGNRVPVNFANIREIDRLAYKHKMDKDAVNAGQPMIYDVFKNNRPQPVDSTQYQNQIPQYPDGGTVGCEECSHGIPKFPDGGKTEEKLNPTSPVSVNYNTIENYHKKVNPYFDELSSNYSNLSDEEKRVESVRKKAAEIAFSKSQKENPSTRTDLSYIKKGAYYCNTHTGECFQDAGATTPEGKKVPVIPGNLQWDSEMPKYGFDWVDTPQPGDIAREQIYRTTDYQGNPLTPGFYSAHSGVVTKAGPTTSDVKIANASGGYRNVYNNQTIPEMVGSRAGDPSSYKMKYQRYYGNLPSLEKQYRQTQSELNKIGGIPVKKEYINTDNGNDQDQLELTKIPEPIEYTNKGKRKKRKTIF